MNLSTIPFLRWIGYIAVLVLLVLTGNSQPLPNQVAPSPPAPSSVALPDDLRLSLQRRQKENDLSGWIYEQLQWVAGAPASRHQLLQQAVREAWRAPGSAEEIQAWLDLLINEGYAFLLSGAIVTSTDAYTAAYDWVRLHPDIRDDRLVLENILKPLGNNYTRLGDYEQALFIHHKALELALAQKDRQALAGVYSNLANTSGNMGRPQQALEYCRKGLAAAEIRSAIYGLLLSEQADAYTALHRPEEAKASISQSLFILERALTRHDHPAAGYWLLMACQQAGDIYGTAVPGKALAFYQQALALETGLLRHRADIRQRERAKLFERLGVLYARLHQSALAIRWMDNCLALLVPGRTFVTLKADDLYAENTLADLIYARAGLSQQNGQSDEALRLYALCFATEKKQRQELITGVSKERWVTDSRSRYETAISLAWDTWSATRQPAYRRALLNLMESSKAQLLLEEVLQQQRLERRRPGDSVISRIRLLEKALVYYRAIALQKENNDSLAAGAAAQEKEIIWELAQLRKKAASQDAYSAIGNGFPIDGSSPIDGKFFTNSFKQWLHKGEVVRSYFAGSAALYTVECADSGVRYAEKLSLPSGWQDSLRQFTTTWFGQSANAIIDHPAVYYSQAYALYRQLFGQHPFQPGSNYILLTDGAMGLLPVDALITRAGAAPASPGEWPYVLLQNTVSYGWSLQTLWQQRAGFGGARGFAGFFLSGSRRALPSLQATLEEEKGLRRVVAEGDWYTDSGATVPAFRKALALSSIVHISSHAYTGKDSLDAPHIELYDAPFYLFELPALDLRPALVVLSACRTGNGRWVTGEGAQSLARAFTAGGVKAVVAGWWNVNDETAARLMENFYAELESTASGSGGNAAAALRRSKLKWLNDPAVSYMQKLPYYWAALNYQGNPRPLPDGSILAPAGGLNRWRRSPLILVALAVILLLPVFFLIRRLYARTR